MRLFLLFLVSAVATFAQTQKPSLESIEKIIVLSRAEEAMEKVRAQLDTTLKTSMQRSMQGRPVTPELRAFSDSMQVKVLALLREETTWDKIKKIYVQAYSELFTQQEIDSLIAFYESPGGEALMKKLPELQRRTGALVQEQLRPVMARTMQIVSESAAEAQKKLEDASQAPSSAPSAP